MKDFYSNFLQTYTDKTYQYPTMVSHKGTVIAFAMSQRRIYYSLLNLEQTHEDGNSDENSPIDVNAWQENPSELFFSDELVHVGYSLIPTTAMPLVKQGGGEAEPGNLRAEEIDRFLSSSARLTADAPYQVLSDGQYVYIFRQSIASQAIGKLAGDYMDMTTTLTLDAPLTQKLTKGTILRIRTTHVKVASEVDKGTKSIQIQEFPLTASLGDEVFLDDEGMVFQTKENAAAAEPYRYVFLSKLQSHTNNSLTLQSGTPRTLEAGAILRVGGMHVRVKTQVSQGETSIRMNDMSLMANSGAPVELADTSHYVIDETNGNKQPLVNNRFLVDRFLLAGTPLVLKREVRFRRSRHKYMPQTNKDSLGAEDMDKQPFYEPTQVLDMVRNLQQGRFTVLQLPTQLADVKRWQIFTYNSKTKLIESVNIERSTEGLFNTQGTQFYTSPDPEHQNEVFERRPGTCPFTEQPLIPIISKAGYAGTALKFSGYERVEINQDNTDPSYFNGSFTVEAWIKVEDGSDTRAVMGIGTPDKGLVLAVKDNRAFMQWPTAQETQGATLLTSETWYHLTWRYDESVQQQTLWVNGVLDGQSDCSDRFPGDDSQVKIGQWNDKHGFKGQIDEIRIWHTARSEEDIKINLHHRLVGNELGLVGYWRFDESEGNTAYDLTDKHNNGIINGASLLSSEAPIGDHPAVRRTIFKLNRTVKSGLAALLYYQQEPAATGNDPDEPKPLKKNARVMLALATHGPDRQGNQTDKNYIATLDFAVSREGRLAQIPTSINLNNYFLDKNNQWQLKRLHTDSFGLTISAGLLDFTDTNDTPRFFDSAIGQLALYFRGTNDQFYAAYFDTNTAKVQPQLDIKYDVVIGNTGADISGNTVTTIPVKHGINRDLSANVQLQVGETQVTVINETPEGSTEIGIQPADFSNNPVAANTPIYLIDGEDGKLTLVARSADPEMDSLSITVTNSAPNFDLFCQVTIKDSEHNPTITETWKRVPREVQQFADVLNGNTQKTFVGQLDTELLPGATQLKLSRTVNRDFYSGDILPVGSGTQVTVASSPGAAQWNEPLDISVEKVTLRAAQGLSVFLEQGNVGQLGSQEFTAEEETLTLKAGVNRRPLQPGDVLWINDTQVTVQKEVKQGSATIALIKSATQIKANKGASVSTSDGNPVGELGVNWSHHNNQLRLKSKKECQLNNSDKLLIDGLIQVEVTEGIGLKKDKFIDLPVTNATLKAADQPVYLQEILLGQLSAEWNSDSTRLILSNEVKRELRSTDLLRLGRNIQLMVEKAVSRSDKTIDVNQDAKLLPKTPVYIIPYDYQTLAKTSRKIDNMQNGSLLLRAIADQGRVQNTTSPVTGGTTESCRWLEKTPGHALSFNGENQYAGLTEHAKVSQWDGTGHLSLEAWVQAGYRTNGRVLLIHHKSDDFRYALGLQHHIWKSALALGQNKYVQVESHDDINFNHDQDFTIEAWIKVGNIAANKTTNIVGKKGNTSYPYVIEYDESSNQLRARRKHCDGDYPELILTSKTLFNDNQFHHVALVKNNTKLLLYIDGTEEANQTDNNTNPTKNTEPLYFGTHTSPNFEGEIDEVRIWKIARTESDIKADMGRQLHGQEAGLVGYWHFEESAKDYTNNGHDGTINGSPAVVNSPLTAYSFFAGVGDSADTVLFKQTITDDPPHQRATHHWQQLGTSGRSLLPILCVEI